MNNVHLSVRVLAPTALALFFGSAAARGLYECKKGEGVADFKLLSSVIAGGILGTCIGKYMGDMEDVFEVVSGFKSTGGGIWFGIGAAIIAFFIMTLIKELTSRLVALLFK